MIIQELEERPAVVGVGDTALPRSWLGRGCHCIDRLQGRGPPEDRVDRTRHGDAPIHHEGKPLDDAVTAALVVKVRASAVRATSASLDQLATAAPEPIVSMSLRTWPLDFPDDIAVQRRAPYEAHADSIMYRQVLAEQARARGGDVQFYNAKDIESQAVSILGDRADEVLHGPRATLGPPWAKDHRMALAATILAG